MLVLCLCATVAHAKDRTDWKEDGLKGKVKEVRTYNVKETPDKLEKSFIRRIFRYDKDGNRLVEEHYNEYDDIDGEMTSKLVYKYKKKENHIERSIIDKDKKLIEKTIYDVNKLKLKDEDYIYGVNKQWKTFNKYDENQNLIEEIHYENDSLCDKITYQYDEKGNPAKEHHSDPSKRWMNQTFENKYDENGNRIEIRVYDENDSLICKTIFKYNDQKKCIEETTYNINGTLCSQMLNKYNEEGKKIETMHFVLEDGFIQKDKYIIDDNGKTSVSLRYNSDGELGRIAVSKFDEVGNPIETMIYCGDDWIFYFGTYYEYEYYK